MVALDAGCWSCLSFAGVKKPSGARSKAVIKSPPEQIADVMEHWLVAKPADGFNVMPPNLPGGVSDFVNLVFAELQRRGLH